MNTVEFSHPAIFALRMQFERRSGVVMQLDVREVRWQFRQGQVRQATIAFAATPMIFATDNQDGVAQSELSLGQIASNEIGTVVRQIALYPGRARHPIQFLANEQQAAAAVEE